MSSTLSPEVEQADHNFRMQTREREANTSFAQEFLLHPLKRISVQIQESFRTPLFKYLQNGTLIPYLFCLPHSCLFTA